MPRRVSYTPKRRSTVNKSADSLITINRVLKPIPERRSSSSRSVHTVDYHMERKMSELEKSLGRKDRQTFEKKFKESDIERKLREELKIIQAAENRLSQVNYKMEEKIANLQMQVVLGEQEIQQRKLKESDMEAIIWEETRRASAAQKKLNSLNLLGDYRKLQTEMDGLLQSLHDMERELKLRKEKEITTESDNRDALRRAEATEKKLLVQINHLELEIKQHREKVNKLQKALTNAEGINQKTRMKEIDLETAHQDELKRHQGAERKLSGMNNYMAVRIEQLEEKIEKLNNQLKQRDRDAFQARAKETDLETKLKNVQKHKEVMEKKLTGSKVGLWSGAHSGRGEGDGAQVDWIQGGSVVWGTHRG
ncbi:hypothetical protein LSAT2_005464 [Lamellibrachia satsuma]|nr:hypothetical protein LSAT2_005464 [Lamellibrachia satsuma]